MALSAASLPRYLFTARFFQVLFHLPNFARLYWRLFRDPRVSILPKAQAERFILRGKTGQVRAELGVEPDQRAELSLRGPDGALSATLATANPDDPDTAATASRLQLYDRSGRARATIQVLAFLSGAREMQGAAFGLADGNGKRVALLSASDSTPYLELFGKDNHAKLSLSLDSEPHVDLIGKEGSRLGLSIDPEPHVGLIGKEGSLTLSTEDGAPVVKLFDKARSLRAALGSTELERVDTGASARTAESSLLLFDKQGNVIFKAPPR